MDPRTVKKPRVLCVDDDALVLTGIMRQLGRKYDVVGAANAKEALEILSQGDEVAVVISDLVMPGMNGVELLRQAMAVSPNTTRILITGFKDTLDLATALDHRLLFRILEKPCTGAMLMGTIEQALALYREHVGESQQGR